MYECSIVIKSVIWTHSNKTKEETLSGDAETTSIKEKQVYVSANGLYL